MRALFHFLATGVVIAGCGATDALRAAVTTAQAQCWYDGAPYPQGCLAGEQKFGAAEPGTYVRPGTICKMDQQGMCHPVADPEICFPALKNAVRTQSLVSTTHRQYCFDLTGSANGHVSAGGATASASASLAKSQMVDLVGSDLEVMSIADEDFAMAAFDAMANARCQSYAADPTYQVVTAVALVGDSGSLAYQSFDSMEVASQLVADVSQAGFDATLKAKGSDYNQSSFAPGTVIGVITTQLSIPH